MQPIDSSIFSDFELTLTHFSRHSIIRHWIS